MKTRLLFIILSMLSFRLSAQFVNGTKMPNWTMKDITGKTWDLYQLLGEGKSVIMDMSAVWCGPCWNYHTSHKLKTFYEQYGPNGTVSKNKAMVFLLEADCNTNDACLTNASGCNSSNQGDWSKGTPYPILNPAKPACGTILDPYKIGGYPVVYMVCPDRKGYQLGQPDASSLAASIKKYCTTTGIADGNSIDKTLSIFPNPANAFVTVSFEMSTPVDIRVSIFNLLGEEVSTYMKNDKVAGRQEIVMETKHLLPGMYIIVLKTGGHSVVRKISVHQ